MFLDRHQMPGVTPEELAAAHQLDLEIQEKYGVRYHTYWFDPANGSVFCLAEGPNRDAVQTVHRQAHGQLADNLIELDNMTPLNAFLGAAPTYPPGTAYVAPAIRTIVFTDVCGSVEQTQALGDDGHLELLRAHNTIVREELARHDGREIKHTGDGIMASFSSVTSAVGSCIAMQRRFHERNEDSEAPLHVSIGINAGEPVTDDNDDLFGAAVQVAARLCAAASAGDIFASVAVRELCLGKPFRFDEHGRVTLKGLPEPTPVFRVVWD
jgi:class 3 adenylate cyclase